MTATLCRTIDYDERLVKTAAFAQHTSSDAVADRDQIHGDESAKLPFLYESL